jgi:ribosomal protein S18 acetylase RimI-like enzyme
MPWRLTGSLDEFQHEAGALLRSEPVHNTVPLTLLTTLRESGLFAFGDSPPVFGWHESEVGAVDGAFLQTPPYPVLVAKLPAGSARELIEELIASGKRPAAVNVAAAYETDASSAWATATGGATAVRQRVRLFRLAGLAPPDPFPRGGARVAGQDDRGLLVDWHQAFGRETGGPVAENAERTVADRLSHDGLMLWEADGLAVAMAAMSRNLAGVVRVTCVYTPPEHRRRGYGGGVTTTVSQAAKDAGAEDVVLFTDLANPTSNALYQRLGYRPVEDRVVLGLEPAESLQPDVTGGGEASS